MRPLTAEHCLMRDRNPFISRGCGELEISTHPVRSSVCFKIYFLEDEGKIASCGMPRVGRDAEHFPPYTVSCSIPERQERSHLDTQLSELTLTYLLSGTYLAIESKVEV